MSQKSTNHDFLALANSAASTTVKLVLYPNSTIKGESVPMNSTDEYSTANVSKATDKALDYNQLQNISAQIVKGI